MKTVICMLLFIIATSIYGQQPEGGSGIVFNETPVQTSGCAGWCTPTFSGTTGILSGTLVRADRLTADEIKSLADAQAEIDKATTNLRQVQASVALSHKMTGQSWMEWSTWYVFDGDFILQRHQSSMGSTWRPQ